MLTMRIAQAAAELLERGQDMVYVSVLGKSGSAPSAANARMLVRADGSIVGTVGGGKVEADARERAAHVFETRSAEEFSYDLTGADVADTDMICGGRVRLLLIFVEATSENAALFRAVAAALEAGQKCYLAASLGSVAGKRQPAFWMISAHGQVQAGSSGELKVPPERLEELVHQAHLSPYPVLGAVAEEWLMVERCFVPSTAYVLGGGHVGQQVAVVAPVADFRTVVLDDRSEYANKERFPLADSVHVISSFEECLDDFDINCDSYIVIVTRGHVHDKVALAGALRTDAGYIGMIGSRAKRDAVYAALLAEGFELEDLSRVHCPIGLAIGGELPGEIAVSIVAEMVRVRAEALRIRAQD